MPEYSIVIADQDDNNLGEITNWLDLNYSRQLNDYGSCRFSVPVTDDKLNSLIALRRFNTKIFRDGTLVWAGQQATRSARLKRGDANKVTILSYEYLEQLTRRFTGAYRRFSAIDAGTIAWTLIDESQNLTNGDLGITQGTIETTQDRNPIYENKNIFDAMVDLTKVKNGFDFEITPDKVFNVFDRKGIDRTLTTVFEYGTNIEIIGIDENFSNITNQTVVLTENERVERDNLTAAGIYALQQDVVNAYNVTDTTDANDQGDANNDKYKAPLTTISFTQLPGTLPSFGSLALGDTVKVRVNQGFYNIDNNYRIYGYAVKVAQNNKESVDYTIGII